MPEFAPGIQSSTLDGNDGFILIGAAEEDHTGESVSGVGDVNGDGFGDFIIGAPYADPFDDNEGTSYVIFGTDAGFPSSIALSALDPSQGFRIFGDENGDFAGRAVGGGGDVNGDGFADIIVGAVGANADGDNNAGSIYVVFGSAAPTDVALSAIDGTNGFRIDGVDAYDYSGTSVANAGDVNGDGLADVVIGAPGYGTYAGAAYVVFGTEAVLATGLDLAALDGSNGFRLTTGNAFERTGVSVAGAGDVNGDGFDDVIVGTPYAYANGGTVGSAFVVFGAKGGFDSTIDIAALDGANGFHLDGQFGGDRAGYSVSGTGDINGDGFDDVIVGAPGFGDAGAAYVVFGKSGFAADIDLSALDGTNGFRIDGVRENDDIGASVALAGDVNGDGFDDLLISADGFDPAGADNAGAAFVVFGGAGGFASVVDLGALDGNTGFRIEGALEGDTFFNSVAAAGDIDADGFGDIVLGSPFADFVDNHSGLGHVVFGHKAQIDVERIGTGIDNRINGGIGDDTVDGLGGDDTLLGHEGNDSIEGGGGADVLLGGAGADKLSGGSDADTADYTHSETGVTVSLKVSGPQNTGEGQDTLLDIENLTGSDQGDTLTGNGADNVLDGGGGNDVLNGAKASDTLIGGLGQDDLTGGKGGDVFAYGEVAESKGATRDVILDFVNGDLIDLSAIDADTSTPEDDAFDFIGGKAFTNTAGELRYTGKNLLGDVDGDGNADIRIELVAVDNLNDGDFAL